MKNHILKIFFTISALVLFCACSEETITITGQGTLTGKVVEKSTNIPLENVKISTNPNTSTIFSDSEGNLIEESKTVQSKVYEKVFLDLQQDEIEMVQPEYQSLYKQIIDSYQREGEIRPEKIIQQKENKIGNLLTDILLSDEEHQLHNWKKKNIFVKDRKSAVGQLVSETILTFRRYLVDQKIQNLENFYFGRSATPISYAGFFFFSESRLYGRY